MRSDGMAMSRWPSVERPWRRGRSLKIWSYRTSIWWRGTGLPCRQGNRLRVLVHSSRQRNPKFRHHSGKRKTSHSFGHATPQTIRAVNMTLFPYKVMMTTIGRRR
jgi:hypothetical protein